MRLGPVRWYKRVKGSYATTWNELTARQLVGVVRALHMASDKYEWRLLALAAVLGISPWWYRFFAAELVVQLWWMFDFLEKGNSLTKNLLPTIRVRIPGKWRYEYLYGPGDELQYVTALEWMYAERFYEDFRETGNREDLNRFVACLYREKNKKDVFEPGYDGDRRRAFNTNTIDKRVKILARVDVYVLLAIMHWYEGCRAAIERQFDRVFTRDGESPREHYGWPEVFMKIAERGIFGDINHVHSTEMTTVLLHMQINAKDFALLEEEAKKQRVG